MAVTKAKPLVSIVMPAYNSEMFIKNSIDTALKQAMHDLLLVVVDDCSTDGTLSIVEWAAAMDDRVDVVTLQENGGVAKARNAAISRARGEWIAFIDSDDVWETEKLSCQLYRENETEGLLYRFYDFIDEEGKPIGIPFMVPEYTNYQQMLGCNYIGCSTAMVRRSLLHGNPFSIDFHHEDYLLWLQLLRRGVKAAGCQNVLMHYRHIPSTRSANKFQAARNRWDIYRRGLGFAHVESIISFTAYARAGLHKHSIWDQKTKV